MKARLLVGSAVAAIILAVSNADARIACGPMPEVLWRSDMETGNLSEWNQSTSGAAQSLAVTASSAGIPPRSGNWVMRQTVTGTGATRMARFPEIEQLTKAGTTFYVSWWDYYPAKISFAPGDTFSIWQINSYDDAGTPNPIWRLSLDGTNSTLMLVWSPFSNAPAEGPHVGESGGRRAYSSALAVPVGQWVFFEAMVTPSAEFTGAIKVWMNGQLAFDQSQVKTRFPDSALGGWTYITHSATGSNLSPSPAHHYVDDVTISLGRMPYYTPSTAMDFDGDCKADILWRNSASGENEMYLMNGAEIASRAPVTSPAGQGWQVAGIGDFDGDGRADILWRNSATGENYVYLMNGSQIAAQGLVDVLADPAWQIVGVGDFGGNGTADILSRNTVTGENYMYFMQGSAITAQGSVNVVADQAWQVAGVGDFNGDGKADILWRNSATGENYVYLMSARQIVAHGSINVVSDPAWEIAGVGDFNGDGKADILWRNSATGENHVYLMDGWQIASQALVNVVADPAWRIAGVGDFNGDGKADILWRNSATGENSMDLMDGWQLLSSAAMNAVADLNWMPQTATTLATKPVPDTKAPSTPANLAATVISDRQIDLSWSPATDNVGVTGYRVYRDGALVATPSGTVVSILPLAGSTQYSFAVAAVDAAGNASAPSAPVSATTAPPPDTTAPSTPTGVSASNLTSTSLTLTWNAAIDNVAVVGYRVYRDGALIASPVGTSLPVAGLVAGVLYSFTVSAFDAAGNASAPSVAFSMTTPLPAPAGPEVLWRAGMETGGLSEWSNQSTSGAAQSLAVTASSAGIPPRSGNWVMRQTVTGTGATRMARFPEIDQLTKAGTTFYVSWWDYYPAKISFAPGDTFSIWQINSYNDAGSPTPIWRLALDGTNSTLILVWSPFSNAPAEGPHAGESGGRTAYSSALAVPVGQWVFFEAMVTPSAEFTGAIRVWMNGQLAFDQSQVKTRFPDSALGGWTYITHSATGSNLSPSPAHHYVDDVTISLGRMPYTPPPAPQVLWRADMETGNLSEWGDEGNSGSADSTAVTAASAGIPPKRGNWVMRQTVNGGGGTRMHRFAEVSQLAKEGKTFYMSWWYYLPQKITFPAGSFFSPWQIASYDANGVPNPIWALYYESSNQTLTLAWNPARNGPAEGPHAGEFGTRGYRSTVPVPLRQWMYIEVMVTPSAEFTGAIKLWLNGQLLFDLSQIKTRFPDSAKGGLMYTSHNAYGSNLTPNPLDHYLDDVTVSLGRMPYAQ